MKFFRNHPRLIADSGLLAISRRMVLNDRAKALAIALLVWISSYGLLQTFRLVTKYFVYGNFSSDLVGAVGMAYILPAHLLTLVSVHLILTRWQGRSLWQSLNLHWGRCQSWSLDKRQMGTGIKILIWVIAAAALSITTYAITIKFGSKGEEQTIIQTLSNSSLAARITTALLATVSAPLIEEIVYRGMLYPALEKSIGGGLAVFLVSSLFMVTHISQLTYPNGVINYLAVLMTGFRGLMYTLARAKTDSLLPSIIMHATCNGITTIVYGLIVFGMRSV